MIDIPSSPDHLLLAVFDGHGGSAASKFAAKHLLTILEHSDQWKTYLITHLIEDLSEALRYTFLQIDIDMYRNLGEECVKCGSTSVVTIITPSHIICANAGDSRSILSHQNGTLVSLSNDHKPNLKQETLRIRTAGGFVTTRRTGGVSRVDGVLAVSRGLGDFRFKNRTDLPPELQKVTCQPEIIIHTRQIQDEFVLLACDGIWDVLSSGDVIKLVQTLYKEGENNEKLIAEEIIDESFSKGSKDNISVIITRLPGAAPLISKSLSGGVLKRRSRRTGEQELSALFLPTGTYCLNENPLYPFRNINTGDDSMYVQSNTDPQLLIHITFHTLVRITSISMKPGNIVDTVPNSSPQTVQVYVNLTNPSFTNIDDEEVTETIILDPVPPVGNTNTSSDVDIDTAAIDDNTNNNAPLTNINTRIRLKRAVKFQRVHSLTIFITDNYGEEFTTLSELNIFGFTLDGLDVAHIHEVGKKKK